MCPSFAHHLQNSIRSQPNLFHSWINLYSLSQMKSLIHKPLSLITKTRIRGLDAFRRRRASLSSLVLRRWRRSFCSAPAVVMARVGPGPPGRSAGGHTRRSGGHVTSPDPFLRGRRVWKVGGSSTEPILSRVAGPKALLQHPGWRNGDRSQRMGPRSHLLWEWRSDAACPWCRGGVAGL